MTGILFEVFLVAFLTQRHPSIEQRQKLAHLISRI